ncbi:50S ribosomal protein L13 [Patescibacteria group bacterium]|nr:50S ribosomal protein L13 [Patescibacteria group bacterium]
MEKNKPTTKKITKAKIIRQKHEIDATGLVLGRLATKISTLLIGKNKASYQPHIDMGDSVIIKNVKDIKITGAKLDQKKYYRHSGFPGGLKTKKMGDVFAKDPAEVLKKAVYNMLPKNKLRKERMKRLKFV